MHIQKNRATKKITNHAVTTWRLSINSVLIESTLIKEPHLRASKLTKTLPWWEGELTVPTAFNPED